MGAKNDTVGFVMSLVTALIVVFVVAQVLAIIDHKITSDSLKGYTWTQAFGVKSASAAHDLGLNGYILLQVQERGEAWYVNPQDGNRYFLGRPDDAFRVMRELGLGVSNKDFANWQGTAPSRLAGRIVLKVEDAGKAYYIHPTTRTLHYLGRPADAFRVMREQGLGITNANLKKIAAAPGYTTPTTPVTVVKQPEQVVVQPAVPLFQYCEQQKYFIAADFDRNAKCKELEQASFTKANASTAEMIAYYTSVGRLSEAQQLEKELAAAQQGEQKDLQQAPIVTTPVMTTNNGPLIRVGLFYNEASQIIRNTQAFTVTDANGKVLTTVAANTPLTIDYLESSGKYAYGFGAADTMVNSYLRFIPVSDTAVFEIVSYENRPGWNQSLNDNVFLGGLELRYNTAKNRTWVINELPMETYLKGIAETSNSSPMEYQKTMMIAARTYATHHLNRATKHADEYFIVDATYDQVYKGYGTQQRLTQVTAAVEATKGLVVTYDGAIVITPYFSWSDGRTRSMKEVWNSDQPWLQSVQEPAGYTKTTLFGHGVGLSAHGAVLLASDQYNYTAEQILKYYYTGIELASNYNNIFN